MRAVGMAAVATAALALAGGIVAVVVGERSPSAAAPFARTLNIKCRSPALGGTLPAAVYLPAGYQSGSTRYPVIYFLHGLPAGPSSYKTNAFVADAVATSGHRAIVVAPQGARNPNSDPEYLDGGPTEDWPLRSRAISPVASTPASARYPPATARLSLASPPGRTLRGSPPRARVSRWPAWRGQTLRGVAAPPRVSRWPASRVTKPTGRLPAATRRQADPP